MKSEERQRIFSEQMASSDSKKLACLVIGQLEILDQIDKQTEALKKIADHLETIKLEIMDKKL